LRCGGDNFWSTNRVAATVICHSLASVVCSDEKICRHPPVDKAEKIAVLPKSAAKVETSPQLALLQIWASAIA